MFLQIEGVNGDNTDAAHANWIEVSSYTHKMSQAKGGSPVRRERSWADVPSMGTS
jgi:type VI protein secretion system component Hcp